MLRLPGMLVCVAQVAWSLTREGGRNFSIEETAGRGGRPSTAGRSTVVPNHCCPAIIPPFIKVPPEADTIDSARFESLPGKSEKEIACDASPVSRSPGSIL